MNVVRDHVRIDAGIVVQDAGGTAGVFLRHGRRPDATLNSRNCTVDAGGRLPDAAHQDAVRSQLLPAIQRHLIDRCGLRNRPIGVARDHVELPFELEIVPQNLADHLGRGLGLGVAGQRNEGRHRNLRRQARIAARDASCSRRFAAAEMMTASRRLLGGDADGNRRSDESGSGETGS